MGSVFRKTFTKPIPAGAEIITRRGERLARWRDEAKGKATTAPLTAAGDRIRIEAGTYTAKYRDGAGLIVEVATGCRDESAARQVLARLEREAERQRAGLITPAEVRAAEHLAAPIADHFDAYVTHLEAKGTTGEHRQTTRRYLDRLADECGWKRLGDLDRASMERWLATETKQRRGARSRNAHRTAVNAFGNWCVDVGRLAANPFGRLPVADERSDRRRQRRALTEDELNRLLAIAAADNAPKGKRPGPRQPGTDASARLSGAERALIYRTLALTGLRLGELKSITIGQLHLDGDRPYIELAAADEKARRGASIPLRADLADDLRKFISANRGQERLVGEADAQILWMPDRLTAGRINDSGRRLFEIPESILDQFNRDCRAAGIPKRDDRGRTVDLHALRHTFGTMLSRAGVPLRTAQELMRHSDPKLTANIYTDPRLLDMTGAIDKLPSLSPSAGGGAEAESIKATGTVGRPAPLALPLAPTAVHSGASESPAVSVTADPARLSLTSGALRTGDFPGNFGGLASPTDSRPACVAVKRGGP